jgi:hypothetical protein
MAEHLAARWYVEKPGGGGGGGGGDVKMEMARPPAGLS